MLWLHHHHHHQQMKLYNFYFFTNSVFIYMIFNNVCVSHLPPSFQWGYQYQSSVVFQVPVFNRFATSHKRKQTNKQKLMELDEWQKGQNLEKAPRFMFICVNVVRSKMI